MQFLKFDISSKKGGKNTVGVEADETQFDIAKAKQVIQDFCAKNDIELISQGHGYGEILINNQHKDDITPYGIDLKMMLEYCGKDPKEFILAQEKQRVRPK